MARLPRTTKDGPGSRRCRAAADDAARGCAGGRPAGVWPAPATQAWGQAIAGAARLGLHGKKPLAKTRSFGLLPEK